MLEDYQYELMKFLLVDKCARKHIPRLDSDIFSVPTLKIIYQLLNKYFEGWKKQPTILDMRQYLNDFKDKGKLDEPAYALVSSAIADCYHHELKINPEQAEEKLIEYAQYLMTKSMVKNYGPKLKDGLKIYREMLSEMTKIVSIADFEDEIKKGIGYVIKGHGQRPMSGLSNAHPTFLDGLNKLTSSGGFESPELVIFMGKPKGGKTTVLINLVKNYLLDGLNVYYADGENGKIKILTRLHQSMCNLTKPQILTGEYDAFISEAIMWYGMRGGDMEINTFPANQHSMRDVAAHLDELQDVDGWVPDVFASDYPDLYVANDVSKRKDKRINIQNVYHDHISLLNERKMFGLGLTQVKQSALEKDTFTLDDADEDFGKSKNVHAMFGINQTEDEEAMGIARIVPAVQREGAPFGTCFVSIDKERCLVTELDPKLLLDVDKESLTDE